MRKSLSLVTAALLLFAGCGGGGGGTTPPPPPVTVSGTVRAPNGLIAFPSGRNFLTRFAGRILPEAHAVVSGLAPVADGVRVELVRLGNTGDAVATIATTATSGGKYTFDLTSLGLSFSSNLALRVFNSSTGKQMRAFVTSGRVDVDPTSEASVQLVLEKVAGPPAGDLSRFTPKEINDLVGDLDLLTSVGEVSSGADIDSTVSAVKTAALADPAVAAYLASASGAGQTSEGAGDVGNFFPVGQGNAWRYHGTTTPDGGSPATYFSSTRITGTKGFGGATAAIFTTVNSDNDGTTVEVYYEKNSRGVFLWGTNDPDDPLTPLLVPYAEGTFPFLPGSSFVQTNRGGLPFPDIGGDGIQETADLVVTVRMEGLEEVTVPVGNFRHCAKVVAVAVAEVRLSDLPVSITVTITETRWFAPGVGLVRRHQVSEAAGGGQSFVDTISEELGGYLADGNGKGVLPGFVIASGLAPGNSDVSIPGKAAVASDGDAYLVVYRRDDGGTGRISATLLSGTGSVMGDFDVATGGGNPAAAFDGTNYLVVYNSGDGLIYGNRVTPSGTVLDGQGFPISTGIPFQVTNSLPAVAFGSGTYLVTWGKFGGSEYDLYGARVTPSATVLDEFPISTAPGEQAFSSVAYGGGNFLVAWRDSRSLFDPDIYGARVTPAGAVLDPQGIPVSTTSGIQGEPAVAFGGGHFLVAWLDGRNYPGGAQKFDIYAARVDPDGTILDLPAGIPVNTNPEPIEGKSNPSAIFDGGGYLVAWQAGSFAMYKPSGIFAARISATGAPLSGPPEGRGIVVAEPGDDFTRLYYPSLAAGGSNALLVWSNIAEMAGSSKSISGALVYP